MCVYIYASVCVYITGVLISAYVYVYIQMGWLNSREEIDNSSGTTAIDVALQSLLNSCYYSNQMAENNNLPKLDEELISRLIIQCCTNSDSKYS